MIPPSEVALGQEEVQGCFGHFPPSEVLQAIVFEENQEELFGFGLLEQLFQQEPQRVQVLEVNRCCQRW